MKSLGYLSAFLGGAIAGAALGILVAPEKGSDTRVKITDAVEDFMKKHSISMLSSDKNVETIAQLIEVLKHYLGLQTEYLKLDVIDKVVRLLKAATLALIFILIIIAVVMYFSFALAFWLSNFTGMTIAFLIVGAIHLLIFILFIIFRKSWIEKPLVHFLAGLLLSK